MELTPSLDIAVDCAHARDLDPLSHRPCESPSGFQGGGTGCPTGRGNNAVCTLQRSSQAAATKEAQNGEWHC